MENRLNNLETEIPDSLLSAEIVGGEGIVTDSLPIRTLDTIQNSDVIQVEVYARMALITEGINTGLTCSRVPYNDTHHLTIVTQLYQPRCVLYLVTCTLQNICFRSQYTLMPSSFSVHL